MNSAEKQTVLHCLKSMIDEEACEECPLYGITGTDHCEKDCIRLAINALEQEPCTDAISRQAAIDALTGWETDPLDEDIEYTLKQLPPVTPAEKGGHWIDHQEDRWIYAKCSECETVHDSRTNYCPNCGARMGGEQNV